MNGSFATWGSPSEAGAERARPVEGRPPPDGDDLFEWEDAPARPPRPSHEPGTGESTTSDTGETQRPDTGERDRVGTGERDRVGTGERDRVGTGEREAARRETGGFQAIREGIAERRRERGDTGEFERSGRRPPPGRRSRRRDLPARVRRRQDFLIGGAVLLVIVLIIVLISSSGGGSSEEPVPLKRLVGQTIVAKLGAKGPNQDLVKRVRKGQVGGVIAFEPDAQQLKADVQQLQQAASAGNNPPLLVMIDQEGGAVKRIQDGPPTVSPADLGKNGDQGESKDQGQQTGSFLRGLGVNVDLAPVLDIAHANTADTIKSRTFGSDPQTVATVGVAFAQGLADGGVVATAKHFPGLGYATVNTDDQAVTVARTSGELQNDLTPFKAAVEAGVGMMMVSSASYPTLGAKKPASLSPTIVKGLLRGQLGYGGVVITDDLEGQAIGGTIPPGVAGTGALQAGDDLLMYATSTKTSATAFGDIVKEVKSGQLDRSVVQSAYDRITDLKESPTG
jgi:beta-N-acetylhexosaminidase